jgi:hypothetical protein
MVVESESIRGNVELIGNYSGHGKAKDLCKWVDKMAFDWVYE